MILRLSGGILGQIMADLDAAFGLGCASELGEAAARFDAATNA